MQPTATRRIESLLALPRNAKKALAVMADSALCVLTVWLAICFRFESWVSLSGYQWLSVALSILLAIPLLTAFGFYHTVIRYVGRQTITAALRAISIYAIIYSAIFTAYGFPLVPRTIGVLQPLLLLVSLALVRLLASQLLSEQVTSANSTEDLPSVLIYGAGSSGQQLAASIQSKGESRVVAFVDDNTSLQNARIGSIPVYSPSQINQLSQTYAIRDVLLAMPNLSRSRRNDIIRLLSDSAMAVRTLPSLTDLASGKITENDLRELDIEDLLGREPVAPIQELMRRCITGKVVLVTGAGGSIGSELCKQILAQNPSRLIVAELNEFALYQLLESLEKNSNSQSTELIPALINVLEEQRVNALFAAYRPHTVYHAAAYKHVPLVEANPLAGLRTNVLGTRNVANAALAFGADDMVMISTDKAVRPTSIMGASKRLAEMVMQALAQSRTAGQLTRMSLVRFGNVLGSSGSVIPKFRAQIASGGPVTVTHPEITRYFMSIKEASQLVIQAAALHDSSDTNSAKVYLLDMGESVRILDLAKLMIQLSGLSLQDNANPNGDIAIKVLGLRPAEKLYEELLIDKNATPTQHPKIVAAAEAFLPLAVTMQFMNEIERYVDDPISEKTVFAIRQRLKNLVDLRDT